MALHSRTLCGCFSLVVLHALFFCPRYRFCPLRLGATHDLCILCVLPFPLAISCFFETCNSILGASPETKLTVVGVANDPATAPPPLSSTPDDEIRPGLRGLPLLSSPLPFPFPLPLPLPWPLNFPYSIPQQGRLVLGLGSTSGDTTKYRQHSKSRSIPIRWKLGQSRKYCHST